RTYPVPRAGARGRHADPACGRRARRIRAADAGAAGWPGSDLCRGRLWLRHPSNRPFARGRPVGPLHRTDRAMIFAAPWVLLALPALPLLWWLLRVTPPAPRSEPFPAIRLLMGLHAREETPARTPWWLLLLRIVAATLVILALARPVLDPGSSLAGTGPVLLVVDDGWAAAGDWAVRMRAANAELD